MNLRSARHTPRFRRLSALGAVTILVLAACGDDDEDDAAAPAATAEDTAAAAATEAPAATDAAAATDAPSTTASDRGGYGAVDTEAPAAAATASGVLLADTSLGQVLTADDGMTVYIFLPDNAGDPTCVADCAKAWPPLLVGDGATPTAGDGVDSAMLGTAANPEGGTQVTYNGWPLYYYAADSAAGDTNGQGVGDVWYVIGADGEPISE
jgi:predicted lipoprotein with Yx(FWY)xxD motif